MRVQRQLNRTVGDKEYAKYVVVVPPQTIQKLKWADEQELEADTQGRSLILKPATKRARNRDG
jgi:antitoxin component of MazEF toxin-antitoxin module